LFIKYKIVHIYIKYTQFWSYRIFVFNDKATGVEGEAVEHSIDKGET